jgi:hypothetical protein
VTNCKGQVDSQGQNIPAKALQEACSEMNKKQGVWGRASPAQCRSWAIWLCPLVHLGSIYDLQMLRSIQLNFVVVGPGVRVFERSPNDPKMQPGLRATHVVL